MLEVVRSQAPLKGGGGRLRRRNFGWSRPPIRRSITQPDAAARAKALLSASEALWRLYDNTGIDFRYNCEPVEWYLTPHSWEERTAHFTSMRLTSSSR